MTREREECLSELEGFGRMLRNVFSHDIDIKVSMDCLIGTSV